MAQSIRTRVAIEDEASSVARQTAQEMMDLLVSQRDTLKHAIALLQVLNEREVLQMLTALFEQLDPVMTVIVNQVAKPEYTGGIKNVFALAGGIGQFDSESLSTLLRGMARGVKEATEASEPSRTGMGVFDLLKALKDPEISSGLRILLQFLKGFGAGMTP
ncbi:DUF1641 domain-containing protein [Ferroacidibacillus organovorans]|uniref:DUF1641 domain-containing protein n=1 Tax=Ferroacidibacillus organovorans TaxID=1765683 RepID=A0A101XRP8_9BACL|nr:DUF1641 domain-containing protein [Ferroacidibacillus organovorans]KUO96308.1 hypothetical protein ATW55_03615 [Ferroacidibacillus organovorans]